MSKVGVFVDNSGNYYTCCCRTKITSDNSSCPKCKKEVIPYHERSQFTRGAEDRARIGRAYATYEEREGRAARVAARLQGETYRPPQVCHWCCRSVYDCKCRQYRDY